MRFPECGRAYLKDLSLKPVKHPVLQQYRSILQAADDQNILMHFPYQSYDYVVKYFEEAANDPDVRSISVTLYRVARKSKIMDALRTAVQNGKQVTAFVEVKARFDEDANLQWAEQLKKYGVKVIFSLPGIKVHSKLALVTRVVKGSILRTAYLGTGNFNESTSKIYTDFGYFTSESRITNEVARIFLFLETGEKVETPFRYLWVGSFNMYENIIKAIDNEKQNAQRGLKASITIKVNGLEDKSVVEKLYEAAAAGVEVNILSRGICCLKPLGCPGSENIKARSIVDRFLEHSRILLFHNEGHEIMYLSSADLMVRNLHHRVECAFPITDKNLQDEVKETLRYQFEDNVKARSLMEGSVNQYLHHGNDEKQIRSQIEIYHYYKRKLLEDKVNLPD
jgi:polyphosphate kinase